MSYTRPAPFSPTYRPPPSPSQPPTPGYSQPATPAYSCPPTPYSPYTTHPPSPMPTYNRSPPSPYTTPHTPYSMPPTPFSPPPPAASPGPPPPTTMANTNNLIYCTPTEEETEAKIEKSGSKQKSRSDGRPHPYGRPPTGTNSETDLHSLLNCDLTPDQKEVFERCLEAAAHGPSQTHFAQPHYPHSEGIFRQPGDMKPVLPSLHMDIMPSPPDQVQVTQNEALWNNHHQHQGAQHHPGGVHIDLPKREIVLDGVNIGKVYGRSKFSALGVEKTLNYFTTRGFKV